MKRITYAGTVVLAGIIVLAGCASGPSGGGGDALPAAEFTADAVGMVATEAWGNAVQIAEFTPGIVEQGVESIEVAVPYGETAVLYHFSGLTPGAPVEFQMDVNADTFMTNSFIEIGILPGIWTLEQSVHPRPHLADHLAFKWIDSVGRFAGSGLPDATDGWERLVTTDFSADENGDVTVMMIINHWTESPPVVYHYFTNPVVRSVDG